MTDFPDLKFKALVNFPADVVGGAGIDARKQNGRYFLDLDYEDFARVSSVPPADIPNSDALIFNDVTKAYVRAPMSILGGGGIADAPNDGTLYGRKNLGWTPVTGGGIPDAPNDGTLYARKNLAWVPASDGMFLQAGTGAVTRTMQNKARERLSVVDFGAVGNGSTDDTAAIIAADLAAAAQSKALFFPAASYKVTSTINPSVGAKWIAEKYNSTVLVTNSPSADILNLSAGFITIQGFQLSSSVPRTSGIYVNVTGSNCKLNNLFLSGPSTGILINATSTSLDDVNISSVAAGGGSVGIDISGGLAINLHNVQVNAAGGYTGLMLRNLGDVTITSSRFLGGSHAGAIQPGAGQSVIFAKISGTDFDQGTSNALLVSPLSGGIVHLLEFTNCEMYGTVNGVNISGVGTVDNVVFDQLITIGNSAAGVVASNAGGGTVRNISVINSIIASQTGNTANTAIQYDGVVGGNISGNKFGSTAMYPGNDKGIIISSATSDIIIANNDLRGNTTAALTLAGSCDRIALTGNNLTSQAVIWTTSGRIISWANNLGYSGWRAFTPVVTSGLGVITTLGAVSASYLLTGKDVFYNVNITMTTNGSAAQDLRVTNMPILSGSKAFTATGRNNSTGKMLQGYVVQGSTTLILGNYDNTYPVADGNIAFVSGFYESA